MELHKIMSGVMLMGVVITAIILFYGGGSQVYSVGDYDNSSLAAMEEATDIVENVSQETKNDLQRLEGNPSATDILSAFFTSAYGSVKTAATSFKAFFKIIDSGIGELGLGSFGNTLVGVFSTLVIIAIFVGIILHIVTKSDRT